MPAVFADETLGTVSDVTNTDTTHGGVAITKPNITQGKDITITYKGLSLKTLGNGDIERPEGKAWIGIQVKNDSKKEKAKVRVTVFDETQGKYVTQEWANYNDVFDSENNVYLGVNADRLKGAMADGRNGGMLTFVLEFDWDGDNNGVDQTVTVLVDPSDTTIYDETDKTESWNDNSYQEVLEDLTAEDPTTSNTNSSSSNEKVNKKANLDDVPKTGVVYSVINYLA